MVSDTPLVPFAIGVITVVALLVWLKLPAFVGLIIAAMAIGIATPEVPFAEVPTEIAESFGDVMVAIGIPILMAAIIGKTLMDSGAADRIVRAFLSLTGEGARSTRCSARASCCRSRCSSTTSSTCSRRWAAR